MPTHQRLAVSAIVLAALSVSHVAAGAHFRSTPCATVSVGGHTYGVAATVVKCSFARSWVAKLAGKRLSPHSVSVQIAGGPPGYNCRAGTKSGYVAMPGIGPKVQVSGNCAKGAGGLGSFGGGPYFNWVVKTKE